MMFTSNDLKSPYMITDPYKKVMEEGGGMYR